MVSTLPVRRHEQEIIAAVSSATVTVITGETGSGKTTQLPQMLLDNIITPPTSDSPRGSQHRAYIAVTQPRRVAAIAVARRVAEERGGRVGGEVGYAVRFEEVRSAETRLTYLTDGTLMREMLSDPELSR
jgi:HrpA-like RNA helicase